MSADHHLFPALLYNITHPICLNAFAPHSFDIAATIPLARGRWAEPTIQLIDGRFAPDGLSLAVADVAGQFSVYAAGPPPQRLLAAPHDQFFAQDYTDPADAVAAAVWAAPGDAAGDAAAATAAVSGGSESRAHAAAAALRQRYVATTAPGTSALGEPSDAARRTAWRAATTQALCDAHFTPYPPGLQLAYREGRVYEHVSSGVLDDAMDGDDATAHHHDSTTTTPPPPSLLSPQNPPAAAESTAAAAHHHYYLSSNCCSL
jgi:hypothetical protein